MIVTMWIMLLLQGPSWSPTCCLCSSEASQSSSWRLRWDSSWSREGSLPGTSRPSSKVATSVCVSCSTPEICDSKVSTLFFCLFVSPCPACQVWAWPRWWSCSSVTRTTSWFWCGASTFSSTLSPTRCRGPRADTPGTLRTARRITDAPATTAAPPCPHQRPPPPASSPPRPCWTCPQLSSRSTAAALRLKACALQSSSSGSMS